MFTTKKLIKNYDQASLTIKNKRNKELCYHKEHSASVVLSWSTTFT